MMIEFYRMRAGAITPKLGSDGAAAFDLYAASGGMLSAGKQALIPTGINMRFPIDICGRIAPRSGLSLGTIDPSKDGFVMGDMGLTTGAGVIDSDHRGEVRVLLMNLSPWSHEVKRGDRIAQIIFERIRTDAGESLTPFTETPRGYAGFGSTGR